MGVQRITRTKHIMRVSTIRWLMLGSSSVDKPALEGRNMAQWLAKSNAAVLYGAHIVPCDTSGVSYRSSLGRAVRRVNQMTHRPLITQQPVLPVCVWSTL